MLRSKALLKQPIKAAPWLTSDHAIPTIKNYINGQFVTSQQTTDAIHLYDPSTNIHLANIPSSPSDIIHAVSSASQAFPGWSSTPIQIRQRFLMEYTHQLHKVEVREEIAHWITKEMGKTSVDAMGDVWRGLEVVEAAGRVGRDMLVRFVL